MPLNAKGEKIKAAMERKYGSEAGERVFYASKNKGTITGVDSAADPIRSYMDACARGDSDAIAAHQRGFDKR
jgi:hypothetical protein